MGKAKKLEDSDEVFLRRPCKQVIAAYEGFSKEDSMDPASCYIGSFAVNITKVEERQRIVNERLIELKDVKKGIHVVVIITEQGVKVFDEKEKAVKMAHAITKVAFSTCNPENRLFTYIAKSSHSAGTVNLQAHVFRTKKSSHAQALAAIASKSFRIAFALATLEREAKSREFDDQASKEKKSDHYSPVGNRRRWAKKEMARGHEYSDHAQRARHQFGVIGKSLSLGHHVYSPPLETRKILCPERNFPNKLPSPRKISNPESSTTPIMGKSPQIIRTHKNPGYSEASPHVYTAPDQDPVERRPRGVSEPPDPHFVANAMVHNSKYSSLLVENVSSEVEWKSNGDHVEEITGTNNEQLAIVGLRDERPLQVYQPLVNEAKPELETNLNRPQPSSPNNDQPVIADLKEERPLYESLVTEAKPELEANLNRPQPASPNNDQPVIADLKEERPLYESLVTEAKPELETNWNRPQSASPNNDQPVIADFEEECPLYEPWVNEAKLELEMDLNRPQSASPEMKRGQNVSGQKDDLTEKSSSGSSSAGSTRGRRGSKKDETEEWIPFKARTLSDTNTDISEGEMMSSESTISENLVADQENLRTSTPKLESPENGSPRTGVPDIGPVSSSSQQSKQLSNGNSGQGTPYQSHRSPQIDWHRLTLTDDDLLRESEWYQGGLSREIAEEILLADVPGAFLVRDSTSNPGCYVITVRVAYDTKQSRVANYLIQRTHDSMYQISGFPRIFPSLTSLIAHYASRQVDLPVKLRLASDNPLFITEETDAVDGFNELDSTDPDFFNFDSCDTMMAELQRS